MVGDLKNCILNVWCSVTAYWMENLYWSIPNRLFAWWISMAVLPSTKTIMPYSFYCKCYYVFCLLKMLSLYDLYMYSVWNENCFQRLQQSVLAIFLPLCKRDLCPACTLESASWSVGFVCLRKLRALYGSFLMKYVSQRSIKLTPCVRINLNLLKRPVMTDPSSVQFFLNT